MVLSVNRSKRVLRRRSDYNTSLLSVSDYKLGHSAAQHETSIKVSC